MRPDFIEIAEKLIEDLGDEAKVSIYNPKQKITEILTDSRSFTRPEGVVFFAINTPGGNDGHKYIEELYNKGIRNFIVEKIPLFFKDKNDINYIKVADSLSALLKIAASFRSDKTKYVAIAGSRGKTTVKEILYQLLREGRIVARSPRSYNSKIGVPVSLWQVTPDSQIALIEAGISRKGEMKNLSECIRPQTVIFTNIGEEHSEEFKDLKEKGREKSLLAGLPSVETIIYNYDDPVLKDSLQPYLKNKKSIGWSFSDPEADLYIERKGIKEDIVKFSFNYAGKPRELEVRCSGPEEMENMATALAFLLAEGLPLDYIADSFNKLHPVGTRLDVMEGMNGCVLIRDSYISDYTSLSPAIDFMMRRKTAAAKPVIIMGDLYYSGNDKDKMYREVAELVRETGIERFIGIGPEMDSHSSFFGKRSEFYKTVDDFLQKRSPSDFVNELILLKGSGTDGFERIVEMLAARTHETVLEVNLDSLVDNYNYFRGFIPSATGIIAMVKASGYGAGSLEIARSLQDCGAAYLAVAIIDEGVELRENGITMPIMVMNPKVENYGAMFSHNLEPEIYSPIMLREVIEAAEKRGVRDYPVHIKLDTGMHRMGFVQEELPDMIELLKKERHIKVSSLFSHLATADCPDMDDYTLSQFELFQEMTEKIIKGLGYKIKRHILNSAGILRFPERHYDYVRLGIGLYGANTLPPEMEKPLAVVSTLRTVIINLRRWKAGETVGYGRKGVIKKDSVIATIPIGYADGINRHLGNGNISFIVNGRPAPTIGNICMDACMLDVSGIDCKVGDTVEIFGRQQSLLTVSEALETIPYEILTSVSPRVRRIYYRE